VRVLLKPAAGVLFRMGVGIVMAGGPIRALQSSFFGTMARIFAALASFFSRRGSSFSGAADMFGRLAQGCDDRRPAGAGMGGLGGNLADFFGGAGGANPYGGGGIESLLGQGSDFFGGAPRSATLDDNLFGGSAPLSGGGIQPKATPAPSAPESAPRDVTIKVRRPGEARRAGGMPTSSSYSEYRRAAPSRTSDDIGSAPYPPSTSSGDLPASDRITTSSGSADAHESGMTSLPPRRPASSSRLASSSSSRQEGFAPAWSLGRSPQRPTGLFTAGGTTTSSSSGR
jgi:hypothetical protein